MIINKIKNVFLNFMDQLNEEIMLASIRILIRTASNLFLFPNQCFKFVRKTVLEKQFTNLIDTFANRPDACLNRSLKSMLAPPYLSTLQTS